MIEDRSAYLTRVLGRGRHRRRQHVAPRPVVPDVVAHRAHERRVGAERGGMADALHRLECLEARAARFVETGGRLGQPGAGDEQVPLRQGPANVTHAPIEPRSLRRDGRELPSLPVDVDAPEPSPHLDRRTAKDEAGVDHPLGENQALGPLLRAAQGQLAGAEGGDDGRDVPRLVGEGDGVGTGLHRRLVVAGVDQGFGEASQEPGTDREVGLVDAGQSLLAPTGRDRGPMPRHRWARG